MEWRVRIRRVLLTTTAVVVLAASALIPIAVFAAPVPSVSASVARDAGDRIPWELSGVVWSQCPANIDTPPGYGVGWSSDALGDWHVDLYEDTGKVLSEGEVAVNFPELIEPMQAFRDCLAGFAVAPYRAQPSLNGAQREMYQSYLLTELAPCLREHGRPVSLPSRQVFENTDINQWYLQQIGAWAVYPALDELLTIWGECPVYPSYLERTPTESGQAG